MKQSVDILAVRLISTSVPTIQIWSSVRLRGLTPWSASDMKALLHLDYYSDLSGVGVAPAAFLISVIENATMRRHYSQSLCGKLDAIRAMHQGGPRPSKVSVLRATNHNITRGESKPSLCAARPKRCR